MKNILITGAGSGLGKLASIELAKYGHFVYATTPTNSQVAELNILSNRYHLPIVLKNMISKKRYTAPKIQSSYIKIKTYLN